MVYIRKKKKNILCRVLICLLALLIFVVAFLKSINQKIDEIVTDMVEEGLKNTITKMINEAVTESMRSGDYGEMLRVSYSEDGKVQSMTADSIKINLLCADVVARISEKLDALQKFSVSVEISDVFDDAIFLEKSDFVFTTGVTPIGGIETNIESEFVSAGINQTNYRLKMKVDVGIRAVMLISTSTIDISTSVNIAEMLIVGDVPTVYWG